MLLPHVNPAMWLVDDDEVTGRPLIKHSVRFCSFALQAGNVTQLVEFTDTSMT